MMKNENNDVLNFESATEVRRDWSTFFDEAVREKPIFIKRTRDSAVLLGTNFMNLLLEKYEYECTEYKEDDGTITLSADSLDIVENGNTEEEVKIKMAESIYEYALDFYKEFDLWSKASNRKDHIPYVFKALLLKDASKIGEHIICLHGKN